MWREGELAAKQKVKKKKKKCKLAEDILSVKRETFSQREEMSLPSPGSCGKQREMSERGSGACRDKEGKGIR